MSNHDTDMDELQEQIGDIFARACKNNEYFGNDGWYELHTPTIRSEIQALITQHRQKWENAARIDERNSGHWFAREQQLDASWNFAYYCNCGFGASNLKAIDGHVAWKLAQLTRENA